MYLSQLIGRLVVSRTGEQLGYVTAARLTRDYAAVSCLVCADADEEEFLLPFRVLLSVGDVLIVGTRRLSQLTGIASPVGKAAYLHTGEYLGTICDVELEQPPFFVVSGEKQERIDVACAAIAESVVVYPDAAARRAAGVAKKKGQTVAERKSPMRKEETVILPSSAQTATQQPDALRNAQATAQSDALQRTQAVAQQPDVLQSAQATAQPDVLRSEQSQQVGFGRTDLLGQRISEDVFDNRGQLVARAGERVTAELIGRARRENYLLKLTVSTFSTEKSVTF